MAPPNESDLESLVRRFSRLVRATAVRIGGHAGREVADDVEQIVFLNLWKQLEREQPIDNHASYIYRCAVRETVRLLSRRGNETQDVGDHLSPPDSAPGDPNASRERARLIGEAIRELP